nr:hypothetical protein [Tanacetum cinerariifolium]
MDHPDITMEEYIELEAKKLIGVAELLTEKLLCMTRYLIRTHENGIDEVTIPPNDVVIEQMDSGIYYNIDTKSHEFDEDFETNHDIHREPSNMEDYLIFIKVVIQNRFYEGILLNFIIKNFYVSLEFPSTPIGFIKMVFARGNCRGQAEEMTTEGFGPYEAGSLREIATKGDLRDYWTGISSWGDFFTMVPSYIAINDPFRRLCHQLIAFSISRRGHIPEKVTATDSIYKRIMDERAVNLPYLFAIYLFRHAEGRKDELVRLHICEWLGDVFTCAPPGPERLFQPDQDPRALAAALVNRTMPHWMTRLEDEVHGVCESLGEQRAVLDAMSIDSSRFTTWTVGRLS